MFNGSLTLIHAAPIEKTQSTTLGVASGLGPDTIGSFGASKEAHARHSLRNSSSSLLRSSATVDTHGALPYFGLSRKNSALWVASHDSSQVYSTSVSTEQYSPRSYGPTSEYMAPSLYRAVNTRSLHQSFLTSSLLRSNSTIEYAHLPSLFSLASADALNSGYPSHSATTSLVISPSAAYVATSPISARTASLAIASPQISEKSGPSDAQPRVQGPTGSPIVEVNAAPQHRVSEARSSRRQAEDGGVSLAGGPPECTQLADEMSVLDSVSLSSDETLPPPYSPY